MNISMVESIQRLIHNDPALPAGVGIAVNAEVAIACILLEIDQWQIIRVNQSLKFVVIMLLSMRGDADYRIYGSIDWAAHD